MAKFEKIGLIKGRQTLFFRADCGEAQEQGGDKYELSTNMGGGMPIVRNERTGKWWTITWKEMIDIAKKMGIDEEEKDGESDQ